MKQWLSQTYGVFAMFAEQDGFLREIDSRHFPSAHDFLDISRERFALGFFTHAIAPAAEAYRRLDAVSEKSLAAAMLYQCYLQAGRPDSAALWLSRAALADPRFKAQAAAFYQAAGYLDKADSLIAAMPPCVMRDTLALRQLLFKGNVRRAQELSRGLKGDRDAAILWRARTSVFSGNGGELAGWIDTVLFKSSWEYAAELLGYRYKLEVLRDAPSALSDFGAIAYAVWLGKPQKAAMRSLAAYPPAVREMLVCELVAALAVKNLLAEAQKAASQVPLSQAGPELRYYWGDILIKQGAVGEGRTVLEQLILSHPDDVFALKGKVILVNLKKSGNIFP